MAFRSTAGAATRAGGSIPVEAFRAAVLTWFETEGRTLPFRASSDPYLVLVSETILQQTQIARGAPAWQGFVARFPAVEALAAATPADAIRAWAGLGYNRRALNLHRVARIVVHEQGGRFPHDVADLERLPGVGPYTARAVAAISFGRAVGAVDTNVRRVLGRVLGGTGAATRSRAATGSHAALQAVADSLVPPDRTADWTHALMDLGATVCRPRSPRCADCPVRPFCRFAIGDGASATPTPRHAPASRGSFELTNRWLRGRILARLREVDGDGWVAFDSALGEHPDEAVQAALQSMAVEGLLELDQSGPSHRARLPIA